MTRYKLRIPGPGGKLETVVNDPGPERIALALIAHPHPLHGGTLDNKVVQTVAGALFEQGCVAVRPNFRGVGMSDGDYDHGQGEVDDMLAAAEFFRPRYPGLPLILAGFSFGAYVQSRASRLLDPQRTLLIAPAVNLFAFESVPPQTRVIHGERDELVPLAAVRQWAEPQGLEVRVIPGADHFFHRRLGQLKQALSGLLL